MVRHMSAAESKSLPVAASGIPPVDCRPCLSSLPCWEFPSSRSEQPSEETPEHSNTIRKSSYRVTPSFIERVVLAYCCLRKSPRNSVGKQELELQQRHTCWVAGPVSYPANTSRQSIPVRTVHLLCEMHQTLGREHAVLELTTEPMR